MNAKRSPLVVSLASTLLLMALAGCDLPPTAGSNLPQADGTQNTGGQQQTEGEQQNETAKNLHQGMLSKDETWKQADGPHVIRGELVIASAEGATLTIEPGTEIRFESGASLTVGAGGLGQLKAEGSAEAPIVFTSASSNPQKGDWNGIYLGSGSSASVLTHCVVAYAGGGSSESALVVAGANNKPSLENCTVEASAGYGIRLRDGASFTAFTSNLVKDSGKHPIRLGAKAVSSLGAGNSFTGHRLQSFHVEGEKLTQSATWRDHGIPYQIHSDLEVAGDGALAVLKIEPGITLEFAAGTGLFVGYDGPGALNAVGESTASILFTSVSRTSDSWAGITMSAQTQAGSQYSATSTRLYNAIVEYGKTAQGSMMYLYKANPYLEEVTFRNASSGTYAVKAVGQDGEVPDSIVNGGNLFVGFESQMVYDWLELE